MTSEKSGKENQAPVNGLAVAAMVVGIVAFLSGWVPFWGVVAGTTAVFLGIYGLKKPNGKGMAIAGLVTGAVGLLTSIAVTVLTILSLVFGVAFLGIFSEVSHQYTTQNQVRLDSKKNFEKGETAVFDSLKVKILSVDDYTPENPYAVADEGMKYISVSAEVTNISDTSVLVGPYLFKIRDDEGERHATYLETDNQLESGKLASKESVTGSFVYAVKKESTERKLVYSVNAYGQDYKMEKVTYTLSF